MAAKTTSPGYWDELVPVKLPRIKGDESKGRYVSVNEKSIWIPRGKTEMVPRWAAVAVERADAQADIANAKMEALQNEFEEMARKIG